MATCTECGLDAGFMMSVCDRCSKRIRLGLSIDRRSQLSPDLALYVTDEQGNTLRTLTPRDTVVCWLPATSTSFKFGPEHNQVRFALPPGHDPSTGVASYTAVMYWDGGGWHCSLDGRDGGLPDATANGRRPVESGLVTSYFTTAGLGLLGFFGWLSIVGGVITGIIWSAALGDGPASGLVLVASLMNGALMGGFLFLVRGIGRTVLDLVEAQHATASRPPGTPGNADVTGGPSFQVRGPEDY